MAKYKSYDYSQSVLIPVSRGTFFALDGCRLRSNAPKEWSGTIRDLRKKKENLEKKVKGLLEEQERRDKRDDEEEADQSPRELQSYDLREKTGKAPYAEETSFHLLVQAAVVWHTSTV
jgi:hypothetical protein